MARTREFDTEAALADAAAIFRDRGYGDTSMRDLCDATGVAVGSLYTAFGSKDGLYRAALAQYMDALGARAERLLSVGSGRHALRALLIDHVEEVTGDGHWPGCLLVSSAQERAAYDHDVRRQVTSGLSAMASALVAVVRRGQSDGSVRRDVDPATAAELVGLLLLGVRVAGLTQKDRAALTAAVAGLRARWCSPPEGAHDLL